LVCDFGEVKKDAVGKIDLKGAYSFFEIDKKFTEQLLKGFEGIELRGRKVRLEMTTPHKEKYSEKKKERFYGSKSSAGGGSSRGGSRGESRGGSRSDSRGGDRGRSKRY
jgi:ATP-dependent RNA helicase DeaD